MAIFGRYFFQRFCSRRMLRISSSMIGVILPTLSSWVRWWTVRVGTSASGISVMSWPFSVNKKESSPIRARYEGGKEVTVMRIPSLNMRVFSTDCIWRIFSDKLRNISFVESVKIFLPVKSRKSDETLSRSNTGSGESMSSIRSDLSEKIGVEKMINQNKNKVPPTNIHPTVRI